MKGFSLFYVFYLTTKIGFVSIATFLDNSIASFPKIYGPYVFSLRIMKNFECDVRSFLDEWLRKSIQQYVAKMDGKLNGGLYNLIMDGIEKPLIAIVLTETKGNQTRASNILGINRNTLRKKIQDHKIKCQGQA